MAQTPNDETKQNRGGTAQERLLALISPLANERRRLGRGDFETGVAAAVSLSDSLLARGMILYSRNAIEQVLNATRASNKITNGPPAPIPPNLRDSAQAAMGTAVTGVCMGLDFDGRRETIPAALFWFVLRCMDAGLMSSEDGFRPSFKFPVDPSADRSRMIIKDHSCEEILSKIETLIILPGLLSKGTKTTVPTCE